MKKNLAFYVVLTLLTIGMFFYAGSNLWQDLPVFLSGNETVKASVVEIQTQNEAQANKRVFKARLLTGEHKGDEVMAFQSIGEAFILAQMQADVVQGDTVILERVSANSQGSFITKDGQLDEKALDEAILWQFLDYYRLFPIYCLIVVFGLGLIAIGKWKGLHTLISLVLTFFQIFLFFVPWVIKGYSIYLGLAVSLFYIVVMSIGLIAGASKKAFVTILSTLLGLGIAFGVSMFCARWLHLTGYIDEHAIYLSKIGEGNGIDLLAIIYSGILIGATGAVMDMAMDISSALYELSQRAKGIGHRALIKSGFTIGTDVMGTMANTLILAYIGSALTTVLLLITYSNNILHLLSREIIIIEILQALSGSLALIATVPFTVVIASLFYLKK
jgi:yibE/F family protein